MGCKEGAASWTVTVLAYVKRNWHVVDGKGHKCFVIHIPYKTGRKKYWFKEFMCAEVWNKHTVKLMNAELFKTYGFKPGRVRYEVVD